MLTTLPRDIIIYSLVPHLSDRSRLNLISITKSMRSEYVESIWFDEPVKLTDVMLTKWYFHSLRNVVTDHWFLLPKAVSRVKLVGDWIDIKKIIFPPTVTHLKFCGISISDIGEACLVPKSYLPSGLTHLTFGMYFNGNIKTTSFTQTISYIPPGVTHLTFGTCFDRDIVGAIPYGVTHLVFKGNFNQDIVGAIPASVTHLQLSNAFNQSIDKALPSGLTDLIFGSNFGQDIIGKIPSTVKNLTLGDLFNRCIHGAFPNGLLYLKFGHCFDQEIKGALPNGLLHLEFGYWFNQDIIDTIPSSVTRLVFGRMFHQPVTTSNHIRQITFSINGFSSTQSSSSNSFSLDPNNYDNLVITYPTKSLYRKKGSRTNNKYGKSILPPGLTHLTFGTSYEHNLQFGIPSTVTHLAFGSCFNKDLKNVIPYGVTHLTFGDWLQSDFTGMIPSSVTHLVIRNTFRSVINQIPKTITHVEVNGKKLNREFYPLLETKLKDYY